jgi:outer membrane protein assembly factor BamE (lipoprotein component of BamABCDE complex)
VYSSLKCAISRLQRLIHVKIVALLLIMFIIVISAIVQSYATDIIKSRLFGEATIYAKGYTDRRFRSISVGMTAADVLSVMGQPLRRGPWEDYQQVWFYTDQRTATDNFWRKWLSIDTRNDRVIMIIDDFWVD